MNTESQNNTPAMSPEMQAAHTKIMAAISEVEKVIVGKRNEIIMLMTAMLSGSHVLIEDVPGTGLEIGLIIMNGQNIKQNN